MAREIENLHVLPVANAETLKKRDGRVIRGRALGDDTKNLAAKVIDVFDLRLGVNGKSMSVPQCQGRCQYAYVNKVRNI